MAAISSLLGTTGLFSILLIGRLETFSGIDGDSSSKNRLIFRTQITTYPQHEVANDRVLSQPWQMLWSSLIKGKFIGV